ncbi:hypothetical protein ACHAXR_004254 [Thalassiosira sp. AJA248-18]
MSLGHLGVIWDTRMRRNQIMRLAAVEIYNEITGYWLWPLSTPDIEHVIDRSMKRVARLISKDYRAPIKVECCGFTIFRCCCKKRNPKSKLWNNIVDGMEDRERDEMYNRGVTDYVDRGEMRNGRYLLEDDAYEAEQKLQYLEDGQSFYSREDSRGQYSRDQYSRDQYSRDQTVYTEDGDTYARGSRMGEYSIDDTMTQSEPGWDEASESQYGY